MRGSAAEAVVVGLPALSPANIELLKMLDPKKDERTVARELSTDLADLRARVNKLARQLGLPPQDSPAHELSQLTREAATLVASAVTAAKNEKKQANGADVLLTAEWQGKLAKVAAAVAKGVLVSVDPFKIRPMHGQPREYFPGEEQESLEGSMGIVGQIQDLIIRKKPPPQSRIATTPAFESEDRVWRIVDTEYEICDGERRWRGAMGKQLLEIRAKLIEIDDEGAYLVAAVSNFNRVGHTTLERARNIQRLVNGNPPFPIEAVALMQGISTSTARKLLDTLNLPPDVLDLMNPEAQKQKGQDVLGKVPSYELARLASKPLLHEYARDLARRVVSREMKVPQLRIEVDRILSRHGGSRDVIAERNQPSRRRRLMEGKLTVAIDSMRDVVGRLTDLKNDGILPEPSLLTSDLNALANAAEEAIEVAGCKRIPRTETQKK